MLMLNTGREYFPLMLGREIFLVDFNKVAATTETLVILVFIFGIIFPKHDTVLLRGDLAGSSYNCQSNILLV